MTKFLIEKGFEIGKIDSTLFTKRVNGELFVCQIYVDDIIFGSTNPHFSEKFGKLMSEKFEMSMMSELKFFLGCKSSKLRTEPLSLKQSTPRTYSRSSICKNAKVWVHTCLLVDILTWSKMVNRLIKRFIALWLVHCYIYVLHVPISCCS